MQPGEGETLQLVERMEPGPGDNGTHVRPSQAPPVQVTVTTDKYCTVLQGQPDWAVAVLCVCLLLLAASSLACLIRRYLNRYKGLQYDYLLY